MRGREQDLLLVVVLSVTTAKFIDPIPDRRRTRFASNGGPRPTGRHRRAAGRGLAAAREMLDETTPGPPSNAVVKPLTNGQRSTALVGIAAARHALSA